MMSRWISLVPPPKRKIGDDAVSSTRRGPRGRERARLSRESAPSRPRRSIAVLAMRVRSSVPETFAIEASAIGVPPARDGARRCGARARGARADRSSSSASRRRTTGSAAARAALRAGTRRAGRRGARARPSTRARRARGSARASRSPQPLVQPADEVRRRARARRRRRSRWCGRRTWCSSGRIVTPGRVGRHDQDRDALVLRRVRIGAHGEPDVRGDVGERGPDLLAVDHPLVADAHRARAQRRRDRCRRWARCSRSRSRARRGRCPAGRRPSAPRCRTRRARVRSRCTSGCRTACPKYSISSTSRYW